MGEAGAGTTEAARSQLAPPAVPPGALHRLRGLPPRVWLVLATAAAAGGIGWLTYTWHYQPWQPGSAFQSTGHRIVPITDGTRDTGFIVTSPVGEEGWIATTIDVGGWHDVRVLGGADDESGRVQLKWQALPTGEMASSPDTATTRPTTVHPGQTLTVWVFATRDDCAPGGVEAVNSVPLRWEAFGVHHVYAVTLGSGSGPLPLYRCYPKAALDHLARN